VRGAVRVVRMGPSKAAGVEFIAENGGAGERLRK
jgi:hypothetical protein